MVRVGVKGSEPVSYNKYFYDLIINIKRIKTVIHIFLFTVQLQGSQWLTSQLENRTARIIERKLIFNLKSQFADVSFLVIVVECGHILFVTVNLKGYHLNN